MTLLEAVDSLAVVELIAVSYILLVPVHSQHVAFFTIAFSLPFVDTGLSDEFGAGEPRDWPDQARLLDSELPIGSQILELDKSHTLGNLSCVRLRPTEQIKQEVWIIQTHSGTKQERLKWMAAVRAMKGRHP
jgi:hypothetical protein